ncbi:MAG: hypothetical protein HQ567_11670 [Candidatus Nealsonbacteria bacterium]|nr:hypothetical protein [Candidatus Nealsonbacteria bacterium]
MDEIANRPYFTGICVIIGLAVLIWIKCGEIKSRWRRGNRYDRAHLVVAGVMIALLLLVPAVWCGVLYWSRW